ITYLKFWLRPRIVYIFPLIFCVSKNRFKPRRAHVLTTYCKISLVCFRLKVLNTYKTLVLRSDFYMSYSIIRVSKVKTGTNTTGIQKHVQRENNNYENEDIDHSKTYLNYDLVNANKQNFNNLIDEKIEQNYTGKRKIRTDAIKHIDGLITSDNDFFDNQTPEDTKQFFEYAKEFLEQEY